jgi:predicted XRE-type DNA-binding protein
MGPLMTPQPITLADIPAPSAMEVLSARTAAGMTQTEAGALLGIPQPRWAEYERGLRAMPASRWTVFLLLADLHPTARLVARVLR